MNRRLGRRLTHSRHARARAKLSPRTTDVHARLRTRCQPTPAPIAGACATVEQTRRRCAWISQRHRKRSLGVGGGTRTTPRLFRDRRPARQPGHTRRTGFSAWRKSSSICGERRDVHGRRGRGVRRPGFLVVSPKWTGDRRRELDQCDLHAGRVHPLSRRVGLRVPVLSHRTGWSIDAALVVLRSSPALGEPPPCARRTLPNLRLRPSDEPGPLPGVRPICRAIGRRKRTKCRSHTGTRGVIALQRSATFASFDTPRGLRRSHA